MRNSRKTEALALFTAWMLVLISILPLAAVPAMAQATTGTLKGTVTDTSGGVIAGATVTAKNEGTGTVTAPTTTTGEGIYQIPELLPGAYTVTVEASNFKRFVATHVDVRLGIVNPLDVKLEPGNLAETVNVTANTEELIEKDQAQLSTTITTQQIENLPSNGAGNGLDTLALLAPGVVQAAPGNAGTNTNGTALSVNGNRARSNNFEIDGSDNNDLSVAGPALFVDNQDQVQEYQVITNNFSAQYGRNQGAVVNIITKSGGNQFHGSAFEYHQDNSALNSLDNIERRSGQLFPNPSLYNVFGGTVGGPLYLPRFGEGGKSTINGKDRYFFFVTYQGIQNPNTVTLRDSALSILPSEFPSLLAAFPNNPVIQDIANLSAFAIPTGTVRPRTDLGSANTVYVNPTNNQVYTTPTPGAIGPFLAGGAYDVVNLGGQLFQAAQPERIIAEPFTETEYSFRFDVKASEKDNVNVRYLYQNQNFVNALATANGFTGDIPGTSKNFGGGWTRQISNKMVNEFRATYQDLSVLFGGGETGIGAIPTPTAIGSAITNISFPRAGITNTSLPLEGIGPANNLPQGRVVKVYQAADNLNYTRGRHSFIFGAEFKHLTNEVPFLPNYNGSFGFSSVTRLLNDAPSSISVTEGNPLTTYTENDQYYFIQDDFRIRENLTLNLGLRYEYTGQPINELRDATVARESNPATAFFNPALPLSARTVAYVPPDKHEFAPRFGFAYTPKFWKRLFGQDTTVIRGGFGIAYDAEFYNILLNVQNGAPYSLALTLPRSLLPSRNSPFPIPAGTPTGTLIRNQATASGLLPIGKLNPAFLSQSIVAPDFRAPYSEQFSLGVQHQFTKNQVAEVRYVGTHGVGLFQNLNGNFYLGPLYNGFSLGGINFPGFPQFVPPGIVPLHCVDNPATPDNEAQCNNRILPQGPLNVRANTAQSIYHSMQSRYDGRFFHHALTVGASYTFSKTIDNASEIYGGLGQAVSASPQDPFCITRCERSLSAYDRPHVLSTNFIYEVPFKKGEHGLLGHVLGGWQLNGVYLWTSGVPYTPGQLFNGAFYGLGNTYLTQGDRPFLANSSVDPRQVGISQIDAYLLYPNVQLTDPNGFYSLNQLNSTGNAVPVTVNDVHFIFNGPGAAKIFGTPFGSAARNSLRGPAINQVNFGIFKNTRISERVNLQFRTEIFNLFNHPNPGYGVNQAGTIPAQFVDANAGVIGSAFADNGDIELARRVIQFGLRLVF